jgi:DNA polymerase III subunit alpha
MTEPAAAPMVHLHVHSHYSMLDGWAQWRSPITAPCTGRSNFTKRPKKPASKPLVGCEFYIAENGMHLHDRSAGHNFHLVALAMNATGYANLMKLASLAQTQGFYYRPRIDRHTLYAHQEGLIVLTACLKGEIPWRLTHNDPAGARARALEMQKVFGDRLYLELQENGLPEQTVANQGLMALAEELGIKLVATNDCHYLTQKESYAHEVLLSIQTGKTINDPNRFRFNTDQLYFKSGDEMAAHFAYCPQAVANTLEVAERCNLELVFGANHFPIFPLEEGETLDTVFARACWDGLTVRLDQMRETGARHPGKRIDLPGPADLRNRRYPEDGIFRLFSHRRRFYQLGQAAKIPVGPGRGSGAGSLAAYCLSITDIDPIPYGLLFERFLNIERVSMPDFDIDFCKERRDEVLNYVRQRYGGDAHVAQIVAYGSMKARAVLRDVGRVLEIPLPVVDRIAKLVPEELKITLKKAIEKEPRLREAMKEDDVRELLTISQTLEGLARHKSTHAAGVVISPGPMVEYLPVCIGPNKEILTQYDMKYTEKTGLIKFDFLGLKTLTVIDRALKLIAFDLGTEVDLRTIPMNDPKTYALLCRGQPRGFSAGKRRHARTADQDAARTVFRPHCSGGPLPAGPARLGHGRHLC